MPKQEAIETITINNVEYVRADQANATATPIDGMPYVVVRTERAGCFAGYLKRKVGQEAELCRARRLWYWNGAASLSQLAVDGVSKPADCKFPCECDLTVNGVIETITATERAKNSIQAVKEWKK